MRVIKLETLESLIEFHKGYATKHFKESGYLKPMVIGYLPDNVKQIVIIGEFENDQEKEMWLKAVTLVFAFHGVDKYVVMNEGWAFFGKDPEEAYKYGSISKHQDSCWKSTEMSL